MKTTVSLIDKKRDRKPAVLTEEKIDAIRFVIDLKLHEHNHSNDYLKVTSVSKTFAAV